MIVTAMVDASAVARPVATAAVQGCRCKVCRTSARSAWMRATGYSARNRATDATKSGQGPPQS